MRRNARPLCNLWLLATTALFAGCAGVSHFADTEHQNLTDWLFHRRHTHHLDRPIEADSMFALAGDLTRLEDQIRRDGSITVKTPDVWGESNLMHYIQEYDQILAESVKGFHPSVQGYYSVADSAVLSSATSLQIAEADAPEVSLSAETIDLDDAAVVSMLERVLEKGPGIATPFELEPTEVERQRSTFVRVNQGLRLKNVGGDNVRDAGYALYKFRIPISVLPGRETSAGYSAVVTMQAEPRIDEASLRNAFQRMVAADVVETLPITAPKTPPAASKITSASPQGSDGSPSFSLNDVQESASVPEEPILDAGRNTEQFLDGLPDSGPISPAGPYSFSMQPQRAIPVPDSVTTVGEPSVGPRVASGNDFAKREALRERIDQLYIQLETAGRFRDFAEGITSLQRLFEGELKGSPLYQQEMPCLETTWKNLVQQGPGSSKISEQDLTFSWQIVQHVALADLNLKRLIEDIYRRGEIDEAAYHLSQSPAVTFFAPELSLEPTLATWRLLIEKEFPVHVFALDPDVEEQNIVAAFQRQRELQLALAVGVAKRYFGMNQRLAASRRLALEQAEIELNRVAVSFSHGNDTFGWYFHPRLQAPPAESSNAAAFARTLWSTGPTENYDLKNRRLEPGTRECEALIVMPSFLEYVDFRVTTNWEQVNHPGVTKQSYEEMIDLGRQLQCARNRIPSISDQHCFRPGDFDRLIHRFDQLEKMLSLQTHSIGVPYEYGGGTEELFSRGDLQHYPRLIGYYGVSFVKAFAKPEEVGKFGVEFFLEGKNFHPTLTHVIVGGQESHDQGTEIEVISRNLLRVTVQTLDPSVSADGKAQVFVATPAGLSNMIEIGFPKPKPEPKGFVLADDKAVWCALWSRVEGLRILPGQACDAMIEVKHADPQPPLLPGSREPGVNAFAAVRVTAIGGDGKPIPFCKGGDASFLQSESIPAQYDFQKKVFLIPYCDVATQIQGLVSCSHPSRDCEDFQLNVELYVKFDAWPAEKVSPTIPIKVRTECGCRRLPQCDPMPAGSASGSKATPDAPTPAAPPAMESGNEERLPSPPVATPTAAAAPTGHSWHKPHVLHDESPLHGIHPLQHAHSTLHSGPPIHAPLPPPIVVQPVGPTLRIQTDGNYEPAVQ